MSITASVHACIISIELFPNEVVFKYLMQNNLTQAIPKQLHRPPETETNRRTASKPFRDSVQNKRNQMAPHMVTHHPQAYCAQTTISARV